MLDQVLAEWMALGQAGDHPIDRKALQKALEWVYREAAQEPPCYVAVLDSPLGAHMAAELLAARACGRKPNRAWAECELDWHLDPVFPDYGANYYFEMHLRPMPQALAEPVLRRAMTVLAAQGGGGDWAPVIRLLVERLGPAKAARAPYFWESYPRINVSDKERP